MPKPLTAITLRIQPDLLEKVTAAAEASGMDRSNWIRLAMVEKLTGPEPSKNNALLEDIEVVDSRARGVIKDLIARVERLEAAVGRGETARDPFA